MSLNWGASFSLSVVLTLLVLPAPAAGQTADELAKHTQNPVASLISVQPVFLLQR